jgi:4-hydroxybenzoyl-CoA reductase subunit alpha
MKKLKYVGRRVPEIQSFGKITGEVDYTDDLWFPNMLFGRIVRSPHPHALIKGIDSSRALEVPGVVTVMTGKDTPGIRYIAQKEDLYPLAIEKVRYIGDAVAVVAAETEEAAREAAKLVNVEYELLPALFDPAEALKDGAVEIHEGTGNLVFKMKRKFGDPDRGFAESDFVFEDRFSTQAVAHCNLEPRCSAARVTNDNILEIWSGTQSPYFVRKEVSHVCGLPLSQVRVMEINSGGGFGSRSKFCEDEGITALLAMRTGRPVRITFSREEEMTTTRIRQPFDIALKTGVTEDGRILARELYVTADKGAYCHYGIAIVGYAAAIAASLYRVPHFNYTADVVYTNKLFGGPFRGFGAPQVTLAIEVQLDKIAEKLGMEPVELRLKNINESGDTTACGWVITSCGFRECFQKALEAAGYDKKRAAVQEGRFRRGIGLAGAIHVSGSNVFPDGEFSSILLKMFIDGQVTLYKGSGDTGTWGSTVVAQFVAEELDIPMDSIRVISNDTELTPQSLGSFASRVCFEDGNAALRAARVLKEHLLESAASHLEVSKEDLDMKDGTISVRHDPNKAMTYGDAVFHSPHSVGHVLHAAYEYRPPTERLAPNGYSNISAAYAFSVQVAEVVVDTETGEVTVEKMTVAQDVGKAINPLAVEGQIEGAIAQGVGYALSEELITDGNGRVLSDCLEKYMIPTSMDMPEIEIILVESADEEGPYGAKGVGEIGLNNTAPAIVNAIHDAIGIRFHTLPVTAEDVYFALKEREDKP